MQQAIRFLTLIVIGFCLSGCSYSVPYIIKVNGYTDLTQPDQIIPGGSFFVMENLEAENPLLEQEIRGKIIRLLETRGYLVTTFGKANYYLFFGYGLGVSRSLSVVVPDYGWPAPSLYFTLPPWEAYDQDTATYYDRWLLINVVDGPTYRTQRVSHPVWVGEARSVGTSSDLRTVLNYLLVADFREFGKNTGKALTREIDEQDPEIYSLTR
jgi:hypothetical protein